MMNCVEATRLISESLDRRLGRRERWGLKLHLVICRFCARYRHQMRLLRWFCERFDPGDFVSDERLRPVIRERIKSDIRSNLP